MQLIVALILGGVAGWLAGIIMKSSNGIIMNIILGLVGGLVGGFLGGLIGLGGGWVMSLILAVAGACLIIWVYRKVLKK